MAHTAAGADTGDGLQVVGLGYCAWDCVGITNQLPEFDSSTVDLADFATSGGGPVATALATLARLNVRTGYIGAVGDDEPGSRIRAAFVQESVDLQRLRHQPGARSPVCVVLVQARTGRRAILCYRGTTEDVNLQPEDLRYIASARILHLDAHHMQAAITAAQWMRQHGRTVVLDANKPRPCLEELLLWTDVLITNSSFPEAYTGKRDLAESAGLLLQGDVRLVVTTLGQHGCACFSREKSEYVPGFSVPVLDTTGAGDAFHGAFVYGLLHQWPIGTSARFANAVAALNCMALGGRAGLPTLNQVKEFLAHQDRRRDSDGHQPLELAPT